MNPVKTLLLSAPIVFSLSVAAEDWPQWRGPNRDGVSQETGLLKQWPAEGPKLLWQAQNLGSGYGSAAASGGNLFLVANQGLENEVVKSLSAEDGRELWSTRIGSVGNPKQRPNYPAARSTPTVERDQLFVLGSDGDLVCLERASGKIKWQKSLRNEFGGKPGEWAYAESPLVDGDQVVCMPGGPEATLVALRKSDGGLIWKSAIEGATNANYSSIIILENAGKRHYAAMTGAGLVGIDPKTGKQLWLNGKTKSPIGTIPTPVAKGRLVFSSSNRVGAGTFKVQEENGAYTATEVYFDPKLPNAIGGFLVAGDYLYGCSGATLQCVRFDTGEIKWAERSIAPGALCYADGRLYLYGENGSVALIEATPEAYRELGRFTPPNGPAAANQMEKTWAYPAIADGRLYLRNKDVLWCYDIKGRQ